MFAPAAPVVGATAQSLGDATGIVGDLHPVGLVLAALHFGLQLLVTAHDAQHRSLLIVLTATVIRVSRGLLADAGFGNFGQRVHNLPLVRWTHGIEIPPPVLSAR